MLSVEHKQSDFIAEVPPETLFKAEKETGRLCQKI